MSATPYACVPFSVTCTPIAARTYVGCWPAYPAAIAAKAKWIPSSLNWDSMATFAPKHSTSNNTCSCANDLVKDCKLSLTAETFFPCLGILFLNRDTTSDRDRQSFQSTHKHSSTCELRQFVA